MKYLNWLKKIIAFPFLLITSPFIFLVGFFSTDWEDEDDVKYFKKVTKDWLK